MKYFLLLLLAFTLAATAQTVPRKKKKPAPAPTAPVLTFERTVCLGPCPVYLVSIFADGRVAYDGRQNVRVLGKKTFHLSKPALTEMLRLAAKAQFATLETRYSNGTTDLPATIIAARQPDGQLKTVIVESAPPAALEPLLGYMASQFDPMAGILKRQ